MERVAITGADGIAGTLLRPVLRGRYHLSLFTRTPLALEKGEVGIVGDLADSKAVRSAVEGANVVVHLAGISEEGSFDPMIDVNIRGTHTVLEAARDHGVRRVLIASSAHSAGGVRIDQAHQVNPAYSDPTSFYGASKVAVEAISQVYAHRYRMHIITARIGTVLSQPQTKRQLSTWLSPQDFGRLVDATASLDRPGHWPVWAISANTRRWVSLAWGRAIGYIPQNDSEQYADHLLAQTSDESLAWETIGGPWFGADESHQWPEER